MGAKRSVTNSLITINVLIFLVMTMRGQDTHLRDLVHWGANFGPLTLHGQWWRLVSCMFVHYGFLHIFMNMIALRSLGVIVEQLVGSGDMLVMYFISGVGASMLSVLMHPEVVSIGASGAIFGLFGGFVGMLIKAHYFRGRKFDKRLRRSIIVNLLLNVGISLIPGIDMAAHMGGFAIGMLLGFWCYSRFDDPLPKRWWQRPIIMSLVWIGIYGALIGYLSTLPFAAM